MIIVKVKFKVKSSETDKFIEYTRANATNSLKEPGIKRFEFYRETETNNIFYLFEIFNSKEDQNKHRETAHYKKWKESIMDLLEEPYAGKILEEL